MNPFALREKPQDEFLPFIPRFYYDFMREISPDDLYEGLLGWGLFADKLPPMFTSASFMQFSKSNKKPFPDQKSNWIRFAYMRNINKKRYFGIPTPFAYERLVRCLSKNWQLEEDPLPALMIGNRFIVECDISQCFPSIYTHALDWAILNKELAKKNTNGKICGWSHDIDHYSMNITNGETHGVLIGPHASNLLAEIILTCIDDSLFKKGFRFIRHIDDYSCYADSEQEARNFVLELESELATYGLAINQKKTSLRELPAAREDDWIRSLKSFRPNRENCTKNDVVQLLDAAISAMEHTQGNASTLNYAFKMLSKCNMNIWAKKYYSRMAMHLAYIYPYLLPVVEQHVFEAAKTPNAEIAIFSKLVFERALKEHDYLSACYALYYAIRYDFPLENINDDATRASILESNDCILLVCAFVYSRYKHDYILENILVKHAKTLAKNENDFQSNWLFVYEALDRNVIPGAFHSGAWKAIKKDGISFIDHLSIQRPLLNKMPHEEKVAACNSQMLAIDNDANEEGVGCTHSEL